MRTPECGSALGSLLVVNGRTWFTQSATEMRRWLRRIDPADVESKQVLARPAATAIYGSRAAYGVVILALRPGSRSENRFRTPPAPDRLARCGPCPCPPQGFHSGDPASSP